MKVAIHGPGNPRGFTFTEMMVTMSLFMMVMAGVLGAHLFGARLFEITKAKLGANDEARHAISMLSDEIRTAKLVKIGRGNLSGFTEVAPTVEQVGSAIQIHQTTDTNNFIRYFWDAGDSRLKRTTNGSTAVSIVANSITNEMVFTSEDFTGRILTDNENNRVIGLTLRFYQIAYPTVQIGPGHYYDFYQLRTKITRRALE
jgi:prepilin-type N-terminal cleavage/methylation domain-containing protein